MSLGLANCQIVLLSKMAITLGNQMTDIRKAARKARLTIAKDEQYLNILKKLTVFKIVVLKNFLMWWHGIYHEELPFCLYYQNTQDPQKGVKPAEEEPTVGVNTGKIFGSVSGDFMPLVDSCAFVSACAAKAKLLALQISIGQC